MHLCVRLVFTHPDTGFILEHILVDYSNIWMCSCSSNNSLRVTECKYLNVQHNSRIYSDSRGIRIPNPDWTRGGAGDGGG